MGSANPNRGGGNFGGDPPVATPSPPAAVPNAFGEGSSYGSDAANDIGSEDSAHAVTDKDARDFIYGRDPNYVANTAASERANAANAAQSLQGQAQTAQQSGAAMGSQIGQYGVNAGNAVGGYGMQAASGLTAGGQGAVNAGSAAAGRTAPVAQYGAANQDYQSAQGAAAQLASMQQGPSAAQAQLQSGLNQAQASNLALARSGHGFGASASALSQAAGQNAAMGQQAANTSAQLSAQETQAWNAQHAQNLGAAAGINTAVGGQAQTQALSQAQLQAQTTAQNDQAQAALTGMGLQAQGQAGQLGTQALTSQGQLGLQGETTGAAVTQAGQTTGLQGTQAAMGAYTSGEQMAGINESAGQAGDLARENMLVQEHGINAGVAAGNAAAVNSGWGTALQTAGAITGTAITATSDANAKTGIKPLDAGTPPPTAAPPPPPPPVNDGSKAMAGNAGAVAGGVAGGAIGSAILPGVGTVLGGLAGSIGGRLIGSAISDINAKDQVQSLDAVPGAVPLDTTGMGYGQTNTGSMDAGAGNAFSAGRGAAAGQARSAADADLHAQAKQAAIGSMIGDMGKAAGSFGAGQSGPSLGQFEQLGGMPVAQGYGMQPQPNWGGMQIQSDAHSKTRIVELEKEISALSGVKTAASGPATEYPTPVAPGTYDKSNWGKRFGSGDEKGRGFLGVLRRPDGDESSEISIGVPINGKQTEIPSMVPTLTQPQREQLLALREDQKMPQPIVRAATDFAKQRIAAGQSPFASDSESPDNVSLDDAYARQMQGYGMQPGYAVSDAHSKTAIRKLSSENEALRAALAPVEQPPPTAAMLNQAAADQAAAPSAGQQIVYPPDRAPPTAAMLQEAAGPSAALDMVDAAPGYGYEYKDPARHGYGQKFGPMAQDLLKTPVGASTVEQTPDGTLAVNTGRLALAQHAAMHSDRRENAAKFDQMKAEIDALKGGKTASNESAAERYGTPAPAAPAGEGSLPDWWHSVWNAPAQPYAPAQQIRQQGAQIGRG